MTRLSSKALVWAVAGLGVASVVIAAVPVVRHLGGESGLPPPAVATPIPPAEDAGSVDVILAWSPFGSPIQPVAGPAPDPSLDLVLRGVVIADLPERSTAIVSPSSGGPAAAFAIGQEVAPGATLAEVRGDGIVLLVDGEIRALGFPETLPEAPAVQPDAGVAALEAVAIGGTLAIPGEQSPSAPSGTESE